MGPRTDRGMAQGPGLDEVELPARQRSRGSRCAATRTGCPAPQAGRQGSCGQDGHGARGPRSTRCSTPQSKRRTSQRIRSTVSGGTLRQSTRKWTRLLFPTRPRSPGCSRPSRSSGDGGLTWRRSSAACTTRRSARRRSSTSASTSATCRDGMGDAQLVGRCRHRRQGVDGRRSRARGALTQAPRAATATRPVPIPPSSSVPSSRTSNGSAWHRTAGCSATRRATTWQPATYGLTWSRARKHALTRAEPASWLAKRPYDLRHGGISFWLYSGVDPAGPEALVRSGIAAGGTGSYGINRSPL